MFALIGRTRRGNAVRFPEGLGHSIGTSVPGGNRVDQQAGFGVARQARATVHEWKPAPTNHRSRRAPIEVAAGLLLEVCGQSKRQLRAGGRSGEEQVW